MGSKWEEFRLDEITQCIVDCPHSTPVWTSSGVIVLRNQNIRNGTLNLDTPSYTTKEGYCSRVKRAQPMGGDIVFTREAPMGEVCKIPNNLECCLGQRMVLIRADEKKVLSDYLLYAFQSAPIKHQVGWSEGTGTTVSNVRIPHIKALKFSIPPLEQQKKIAHILSTLDAKIILNQKMNKTLETMAQALFKSWFVDFEPFGGVMPSDWKEGCIADICTLSNKKIPVNTLSIQNYYSTENMLPNKAGATLANTMPATGKITACKKHDILISNIRPYFKKIYYCTTDSGCSNDVLCFSANSTTLAPYLYFALFDDNFFDHMMLGSKGTKMPRGDKKQIMKYKCCIPSDIIIYKFFSITNNIMIILERNKFEKKHLAKIRDVLLQKLINGEIHV